MRDLLCRSGNPKFSGVREEFGVGGNVLIPVCLHRFIHHVNVRVGDVNNAIF